MSYDFNGKIALITGGASGIGLEYVNRLLQGKIKGVAIVDINETLGQKVASELGKQVQFFKADVSNKAELEDVFKKVITEFGALDIVVNNAGFVHELNWERMVSINVNGVVNGTLLAFEYMGRNKGKSGGLIINTGSTLGLEPANFVPIYSSTKSFIITFGRAMGTNFFYDLTGVKVLTICPGYTNTGFTNHVSFLPGFDGLREYAKDVLCGNKYEIQKTEHVGRAIVEVIKKGDNGSVWVSTDGKPAYAIPTAEEKLGK